LYIEAGSGYEMCTYILIGFTGLGRHFVAMMASTGVQVIISLHYNSRQQTNAWQRSNAREYIGHSMVKHGE
jgi:hypothetical protein